LSLLVMLYVFLKFQTVSTHYYQFALCLWLFFVSLKPINLRKMSTLMCASFPGVYTLVTDTK
jgi:hypothetical protein